jgi:hypothetical protein
MNRTSRFFASRAVGAPHRRRVSSANLANRTPLQTALLNALKASQVIKRSASAGVGGTADAAPRQRRRHRYP